MRYASEDSLHRLPRIRRGSGQQPMSGVLPDVAERWRLFASAAARSAEANDQSRAGLYVARLRARRASVGIGLLARLA